MFWLMLMKPVNAPALWWPCACLKCASGLRRLEKTWTFWDAFVSLTWCSNIVRPKWRKLATDSLWFDCVDGYSCLRCWNEFFSSMFQVLGWNFLALQCHGNVCNWIPKLIWPRLRYFLVFCWNMPRFVHFISALTQICMICSIFILFWRHKSFSIVSLRGILVCSLNVPVIFSQRTL